MMRSSQIAPLVVTGRRPTDTDTDTTKETTTSKSTSYMYPVDRMINKSNTIISAEGKHQGLKAEFQTRHHQSTKSFPLSLAPYEFNAVDHAPPFTSSAVSVKEDSIDTDTYCVDDDNVGDNNDSNDNDNNKDYDQDDLSSTDDPYTYSDDSASLSDAYFLQQHSPDFSAGGYYGLAPITPEITETVDTDSTCMWSTLSSSSSTVAVTVAPLIHLDTRLSPGGTRRDSSAPNSRRVRNTNHQQRRRNWNQRQRQQNSSSSSPTIDEDELVTENTKLLNGEGMMSKGYSDGGGSGGGARSRILEESFHEENDDEVHNNNNPTTAAITTHRRRRKKHLLRKYKRNWLLQQQQQRQEERERAVLEVRGRIQPPKSASSNTDRFWLGLFVLQLLFVCGYAIKYGVTLIEPGFTITAIERALYVSPSSSAASGQISSSSSSLSLSPSLSSSTTVTFHNNGSSSSSSSSSMFPINEIVNSNVAGPGAGSFSNFHKENNRTTVSTNTTLEFSGGSRGDTKTTELFTIDYKNVLSLLLISGLYTCVTSYLSFAFMLILGRSIIPIMLVFTILLLLCWGVFGLTLGTYSGSIISLFGFTFFGLSFAYTVANWNHIPFCGTNFYTAICAMRSSTGILLVGIASLFVALFWLLLWTVALMGIFNHKNLTDCKLWDECETHVFVERGEIILLTVLIVSLYWTTMVIKNIVRAAVSGAIGRAWWFGVGEVENNDTKHHDESEKNYDIVVDPLIQACTSSLGTICFGSLVDVPAQILAVIVAFLCWMLDSVHLDHPSQEKNTVNMSLTRRHFPNNNDDEELEDDPGSLREKKISLTTQEDEMSTKCYYDTVRTNLHLFERVLKSYNHWSYTYIGMYNYSFCDGGEKAIQLFETREWMDIIRDNLIQNILFMATIVIGGSSGTVAVVVEEVDDYMFTSLHRPIIASFWIGFFLGFILSNILFLGLAGSAVNTILVCFAAEPFEFDRNHPRLSGEMREVWSQQVWEPESDLEKGDQLND
mmetsp:Transcript_62916/g.72342  ORF Transcript_62916/g.72342 Transcript_62916/m.72342 type:complete len:1002 (-) Transcript_62916:136-3141(-)